MICVPPRPPASALAEELFHGCRLLLLLLLLAPLLLSKHDRARGSRAQYKQLHHIRYAPAYSTMTRVKLLIRVAGCPTRSFNSSLPLQQVSKWYQLDVPALPGHPNSPALLLGLRLHDLA